MESPGCPFCFDWSTHHTTCTSQGSRSLCTLSVVIPRFLWSPFVQQVREISSHFPFKLLHKFCLPQPGSVIRSKSLCVCTCTGWTCMGYGEDVFGTLHCSVEFNSPPPSFLWSLELAVLEPRLQPFTSDWDCAKNVKCFLFTWVSLIKIEALTVHRPRGRKCPPPLHLA